jgi:hypothetical protein
MNTAKRKKLESAGWKTGTAKEFLNLTDDEAEAIEQELEKQSNAAKDQPERPERGARM